MIKNTDNTNQNKKYSNDVVVIWLPPVSYQQDNKKKEDNEKPQMNMSDHIQKMENNITY